MVMTDAADAPEDLDPEVALHSVAGDSAGAAATGEPESPPTERKRSRRRQQPSTVETYLAWLFECESAGFDLIREQLEERIGKLREQLKGTNVARRLRVADELAELERRRRSCVTTDELKALERGFVAEAATYAEANGHTRRTFEINGVPAALIREAGITGG